MPAPKATLCLLDGRYRLELDPLAARRGSTLLVAAEDGPIPVWIDGLQFETVVINLVANAIKHTPPGSSIEISVEAAGSEVLLAVRDDGPGIPAAELPKLFERFYRARGASQDDGGGFGLGLALVREVVERHGGAIDVASSAAGTTFSVRLRSGRAHIADEDCAPYDRDGMPQRMPELVDAGATEDWAPSGPAGAPVNGEDSTESDRTTVLVVDDNADLRRLVRRQLAGKYRVLEAADSEEALAALAVQLPDLVLTDVMMPGLDGYALCRAIRADPAIDFIPVVLLTAKASVDARVEGLDEGADAYLAKPFDAKVLRATIAGLIASRRRLRDRYAAAAPAAADHRVLPVAEIPTGAVELTGIAVIPGQRFFNLAAQPKEGWEPVWQNLDLGRFQQALPYPLQPVVVQLDASAPGGYLREWPRPDERADRHRSYALQWFGFAIASLGIWAYFLVRRT